MAEEAKPESLVALRQTRERVIAQLSEAFARDDLEMDEFERRLTVAHQSGSVAELDRLTTDLAPAAAPTTALAPAAPVAVGTARDRQRLLAVMGGVQRGGRWTPPRHLRVVCVMGGAELDFRDAALPPGVTEIEILAYLGGANIIVPPHLAVEMAGSAIMGGFAHAERAPSTPDPERPVLRITGFAFMGGVNVETRLAGDRGQARERRVRHRERALRGRRERLLTDGEE